MASIVFTDKQESFKLEQLQFICSSGKQRRSSCSASLLKQAHLKQSAQDHIQSFFFFSISKDRDSTKFLRNLDQCSITLTIDSFLVFKWNLTFQFVPTGSFSCHWASLKRAQLNILYTSRYLYAFKKKKRKKKAFSKYICALVSAGIDHSS